MVLTTVQPLGTSFYETPTCPACIDFSGTVFQPFDLTAVKHSCGSGCMGCSPRSKFSLMVEEGRGSDGRCLLGESKLIWGPEKQPMD